MAEKEYMKPFIPYKPPGVVIGTSDFYISPKFKKIKSPADFLKIVIIVKSFTLISYEGEIKINNVILDNKKPIQLVEGDNITFAVNPVTNSISISANDPKIGMVGTKQVDETLIGHGKVLSYDATTTKLIYIDLTTVVQDLVNTAIENADIPTTITETVTNEVDTKVPGMINDKFNSDAPAIITDKVNQILPGMVDAEVADAINALPKDNLVVRENPIGMVDGINPYYVLNHIPKDGTEQVYLNGVLQDVGIDQDYTIDYANRTIRFNSPPPVNSRIRVTYIYVS